jgi:hypothetical protein
MHYSAHIAVQPTLDYGIVASSEVEQRRTSPAERLILFAFSRVRCRNYG